jgi:hypothetical protein
MSDTVIVGLLSLLGTGLGGVISVLTANKLTNYKIEQLQKQVEKHNTIIERTYKLEENAAVMDEQIKVANHRIQDLERKLE